VLHCVYVSLLDANVYLYQHLQHLQQRLLQLQLQLQLQLRTPKQHNPLFKRHQPNRLNDSN